MGKLKWLQGWLLLWNKGGALAANAGLSPHLVCAGRKVNQSAILA